MCSISSEERRALLERCDVLLYTPENEHFGIVPVEGMLLRCIVLACNSGGPKESVLHGRTGFLIEGGPEQWSLIMKRVLVDMKPEERARMMEEGRRHVLDTFSFDTFKKNLKAILDSM